MALARSVPFGSLLSALIFFYPLIAAVGRDTSRCSLRSALIFCDFLGFHSPRSPARHSSWVWLSRFSARRFFCHFFLFSLDRFAFSLLRCAFLACCILFRRPLRSICTDSSLLAPCLQSSVGWLPRLLPCRAAPCGAAWRGVGPASWASASGFSLWRLSFSFAHRAFCSTVYLYGAGGFRCGFFG